MNCSLKLPTILSSSQITVVNICFLLLNILLRKNMYHLNSFVAKEGISTCKIYYANFLHT